MLVLARRRGEEIRIGEFVRIVVISVKGSQVRLGFEAPREIGIVRGELAADAAEFIYDDFECPAKLCDR